MSTYQEFLDHLVKVPTIFKVSLHRLYLTDQDINLIKSLPIGTTQIALHTKSWQILSYSQVEHKWFVYIEGGQDDIEIYNRELILLFIDYVQLGLDWEVIKQMVYAWVTEHKEY